MSDEPERYEKTEEPSQRKLEEAHRKGNVVKSQEVTTWFSLFGSALLFAILAPMASAQLMTELSGVLANADMVEVGSAGFSSFFWQLAGATLLVLLVPVGVMTAFAVAGNMVQHAPVLSLEPIKPKWSKVSPVEGFKRLFSGDALVNFVKGLFKIGIVGAIMFFVLWPEQDRLETLITDDPWLILEVFREIAMKVFLAVVAIVTLIAGADYMYQRHKWWERQKMTLKEVKDEYKQAEGDPHVKSRIRQIRMERGRQRMMAAVPTATVVITNPTHFAVALKYDRSMPAPVCVAKGSDAVALRIREVAAENDVPLVENPPLARALYASVEIDDTIPAEHYQAVAQVVGYVMRLRDKSRWRR